MIGRASPTSSADHPLLHPRTCAKMTKGLRPELDELRGSGQLGQDPPSYLDYAAVSDRSPEEIELSTMARSFADSLIV